MISESAEWVRMIIEMRRKLRRNATLIASGDTGDELKSAMNPANSPRTVKDA